MAAAEEKISIIRNDNSISHCTRRITKIKSGRQTGADQVALDVDIKRKLPSSPKRAERGVNFGLSFRMGAHRWSWLYPGDVRKALEGLDKYRRGRTGYEGDEDISDDNVYFGNVAMRFR
ncbi:MAG: hypothetical protein R6U13_07135 [Desulfatiglandaceae bacterium]